MKWIYRRSHKTTLRTDRTTIMFTQGAPPTSNTHVSAPWLWSPHTNNHCVGTWNHCVGQFTWKHYWEITHLHTCQQDLCGKKLVEDLHPTRIWSMICVLIRAFRHGFSPFVPWNTNPNRKNPIKFLMLMVIVNVKNTSLSISLLTREQLNNYPTSTQYLLHTANWSPRRPHVYQGFPLYSVILHF